MASAHGGGCHFTRTGRSGWTSRRPCSRARRPSRGRARPAPPRSGGRRAAGCTRPRPGRRAR
ncbi:hypothetical protein AN221_23780 [Streptomyces nanshensis]|uniref:Uncharacterized protein n=1 Tax=Streptomyces nanshensis TaxID=518642 RepID=A0A1E7LPM7_9ACTN|nr:hypothetical protein AN221_23780 [Streptomyces nanshensis]